MRVFSLYFGEDYWQWLQAMIEFGLILEPKYQEKNPRDDIPNSPMNIPNRNLAGRRANVKIFADSTDTSNL